MHQKKCSGCDGLITKRFKSELEPAKYCSNLCRARSRIILREFACQFCNKKIILQGKDVKGLVHYCSKECLLMKRNERRTGENRVCKECSSVFYVYKSQPFIRFCSRSCMYKNKDVRDVFKKINLGRTSWRKGTTKFKNAEEKRQSNLRSGRKSYRKNIEKRLFYYRNLANIRKGISGNFTKEEWENLKKEQNYKCKICDEVKTLTIDHIIPISKWNAWKKENRVNYECNDLQNIQGLCKSCNSRKSNKL